MSDKTKKILIYSTLLIVCLYFLFLGLVKAKTFLAPLSLAALLAMVMLPVCRWFEQKGTNRGWASLFSTLIILLFFMILAGVVSYQVKSLVQDWPKIQERLKPKIEQLQEFVADKTGLSVQEQDQKIAKTIPGSNSSSGSNARKNSSENPPDTTGSGKQTPQNENPQKNQSQQNKSSSTSESGSKSSESGIASSAGNFLMKFFSITGTFLLIHIYIFFFLLYRKKFRTSILKMVPEGRQHKAKKIISESSEISQSYLFGRLILIIFLAAIYSAGLSISGVKHAILISVLAAVLSLIPYIGNIIGFVLAIGLALFSGSGLTGVIGVSVTFAIAQFVESYILEPYIVGDKVNLNPVVTILAVVLGGAVWGVAGMLIAIPALGIAKVVFDRIEVLNPLGYLLGNEDIGNDNESGDNFFDKTKRWAKNKFK